MSIEEGSEADVFEEVSDAKLSTSEKLNRLFQEFVVIPFSILWSDWRARFGFTILMLYIFLGTVGLYLVPKPSPGQGPRLLGALQSWQHPMGTDRLGQDLWALHVHATPAMLKMMATGAVIAVLIASVVGIVSGYKGGRIDTGLMTVTDIMMTLPGLPLTIVIAAILDPRSPYVVGFILTIHSWSGLARALRSQVLTLREESYVEASRVMGMSVWSITAKDLVPNLAPYIGVNFMTSARGVIFGSVGLYFLAVLPFSNLNWGVVLNQAYQNGAIYRLDWAHWLLAPLVVITIITLALILLAQGMDRLFNPRVRARHADKDVEGEDGSTASTADVAADFGG